MRAAAVFAAKWTAIEQAPIAAGALTAAHEEIFTPRTRLACDRFGCPGTQSRNFGEAVHF